MILTNTSISIAGEYRSNWGVVVNVTPVSTLKTISKPYTKMTCNNSNSLNSNNLTNIALGGLIGSVFGNKNNPTFFKETFRASYGAGVKFYTPIGPIGLSWSFPIMSENYDIKRSFLFSIGDLN